MQVEAAEQRIEVDLNFNLKIDLPSPSPPPSHTSLPSESTESTTSSARSSFTPETTPETTPDGSVIVDTSSTITSTDTITNSPTTITAPPIPIPPIPPNSTLAVPGPVPRRYKSTGILMTSNTTRLRSTSLPGSSTSLPSETMANPNIKFAPLPELAPRKRKSNIPLGVAARGQIMRRRRAMLYGNVDNENGSPMWTDEETEAHMRRQLESQEKRRISLLRAMQEEEERRGDEVEDPFVALGKMMKGAWRKMSGKDKGKGAAGTANSSDQTPSPPDKGSEKDDDKEKTSAEEPERKASSSTEEGVTMTGSGTQQVSNEKAESRPEDWQTETIVD
ncbi:hypothetical protein VKT23_004669 [Stygiomarasmius scandens]|uniref:Uncharacterized protein n=1 Tax=Marasmiellus scandens TaxID=2682957 RepID=A0ABR1JZ26_9AGAR